MCSVYQARVLREPIAHIPQHGGMLQKRKREKTLKLCKPLKSPVENLFDGIVTIKITIEFEIGNFSLVCCSDFICILHATIASRVLSHHQEAPNAA